MPLNPELGLKVIALNLTADQVERMRALQREQTTTRRRVSLSEIAREVVEQGLAAASCAPTSDKLASDDRSVA